MLTEEQVASFAQNGYLLGDTVLSEDQVEELRSELERVIDAREAADVRQPARISNLGGNPDRPVWQVVNIWMASEPFHRLIHHPQVVEEVAQLTRAHELRVWHDQIQYKPAEKGGVNMWHQDSPYWPILQPKDTQVTAWIALDAVDEENGCMSMVPGSHHWGVQIDFLHTLSDFQSMPAEFEGREVRIELRPVRRGQVHYHHPLTWHGSNATRSGRPRRAIAIHYMTSETRYDAQGEHVMKPYVEVEDGEVLQGEAFPEVWKAGRCTGYR